MNDFEQFFSPAKIAYDLEISQNIAADEKIFRMKLQKIDFSDSVWMKKNEKKSISIAFTGKFAHKLPNNEDSPVYNAAKFLLHKWYFPFGVDIVIEKNIPPFSGFGSADSNVSTVIKTLCEWHKKKEMLEIDFSVLSENHNFMKFSGFGLWIPFFLSPFDAAVVEFSHNSAPNSSHIFSLTPLQNPVFSKTVSVDFFPSVKIPKEWWMEKMNNASHSDFSKILWEHFPDWVEKSQKKNMIPFSSSVFF